MELESFCSRVYVKYFMEFLSNDLNKDNYSTIFESPVGQWSLVCMWIIGILGNLVNIVVFGHRNMIHPINLIFWWLSMSDLLELAILVLQQWSCEWCFDVVESNIGSTLFISYIESVLFLSCIYLIQVFHTTIVGLNIALTFWRYLALAYPMNNRIPCDNHSVKLTIIWIYAFSFVIYLPVWYMYKIYYTDFIQGHELWRTYALSIRESDSDSGGYISKNRLINLSMFVCGIVLRIGPLIILTILSAFLIFAVVKTSYNRQHLGIQVSRIRKARRSVNQMNITIIVIVLMFLTTELPFAMSWIFILLKYEWCFSVLNKILVFTILLSTSYNIFCYLITSRQYRETTKLLLNKFNYVNSAEHIVAETDLELPLQQQS